MRPVFAAPFLLCWSLLTFTTMSFAQTRDAVAIDLIAKTLSTMAVQVSPTLQTIAQGTITDSNGKAKSLTIETSGLDRLRNDVDTDFTFVSSAGGGFLSLDGKKHDLRTWVTKYKRPEHLPALSLIADYLNLNLQIKYVGIEKVNGLPAHHLRLSMLPTDGTPADVEDLASECHVYIDQASMLVVQIRTFDFSPETVQNRSPVDTFFSDYRKQDGALVPFQLSRYIAGQKDSDVVFTSISLTANNPDSDFQ